MKTQFFSRKLAAVLPLGAALLGTATMALARPFDNAAGKHRHQESGALKQHQQEERRYGGGIELKGHQKQERNAKKQHQRAEGGYDRNGGYYGNGGSGNGGGYGNGNGTGGGYYGNGNGNGGYYGNGSNGGSGNDAQHRAHDDHDRYEHGYDSHR